MTESSDIEYIVMRRVRRVRALRPFLSGTAFAALVLTLALWAIGREVWVARVFENGPHSWVGHTEYLAYAFEHTRVIVQALTLTVLAAGLYLARAAARRLVHGLEAAIA